MPTRLPLWAAQLRPAHPTLPVSSRFHLSHAKIIMLACNRGDCTSRQPPFHTSAMPVLGFQLKQKFMHGGVQWWLVLTNTET
jgi:hypothetical protein